MNLLAEHGNDLRRQNMYKKTSKLMEKPVCRLKPTVKEDSSSCPQQLIGCHKRVMPQKSRRM